MRYTVRKNRLLIVGGIWMPYGALCSLSQDLTDREVEDLAAWAEKDVTALTRDDVMGWPGLPDGDFSSVVDVDVDFTLADGRELRIPFTDQGEECWNQSMEDVE